jgi:CheY-like chemotaxis protein
VRKLLLVIEDYAELISLESLLRRVGFDVLSLSREASVAETALAFTPDLLLATYRGRNIDGLRLAQRMKAQVGHRLRVLFILPPGFDPKDPALARVGADAWLPLPVDHVRTLRILSRILNIPVEPLVEKLGKIESARLDEAEEMYLVQSGPRNRDSQFVSGYHEVGEAPSAVGRSGSGTSPYEEERVHLAASARRQERFELAIKAMEDEDKQLPPMANTHSIKSAATQLKEFVQSQSGEEARLQKLDAEKRRFVVALLESEDAKSDGDED